MTKTKEETIRTMIETLTANNVDFSRESPRDAARMGLEMGFDAGYDFAKSEDRWHVIERDGLPDENEWFLVTTAEYGSVAIALFAPGTNTFYLSVGKALRTPKAWRPLPEPYKEDASIEAEALADWEAIQREQSTNR